jgi:hypothetical protein
MKQQRCEGIITVRRHHQLGYTDIKCRFDWLTSGQGLVKADAEADR